MCRTKQKQIFQKKRFKKRKKEKGKKKGKEKQNDSCKTERTSASCFLKKIPPQTPFFFRIFLSPPVRSRSSFKFSVQEKKARKKKKN